MQHELKILPEYYEAKLRGLKPWELRKDDRNFEVGDTLREREFLDDLLTSRPCYTGRELVERITYILRGHEGLSPGYCLMSCERVT